MKVQIECQYRNNQSKCLSNFETYEVVSKRLTPDVWSVSISNNNAYLLLD